MEIFISNSLESLFKKRRLSRTPLKMSISRMTSFVQDAHATTSAEMMKNDFLKDFPIIYAARLAVYNFIAHFSNMSIFSLLRFLFV